MGIQILVLCNNSETIVNNCNLVWHDSYGRYSFHGGNTGKVILLLADHASYQPDWITAWLLYLEHVIVIQPVKIFILVECEGSPLFTLNPLGLTLSQLNPIF
jgi:hypothetical protein